MEEVHGKTIFFVSLALLLVGYFADQFSFTTGYITAAGDTKWTCRDVNYALSYLEAGRKTFKTYDFNKDGSLDLIDIALIREEAKKRPCDLPPECAEEGRQYCGPTGNMLITCVKDEFGRLITQEDTCPQGMICVARQYTVPNSDPKTFGKQSHGRDTVRTASCQYRRNYYDDFA